MKGIKQIEILYNLNQASEKNGYKSNMGRLHPDFIKINETIDRWGFNQNEFYSANQWRVVIN